MKMKHARTKALMDLLAASVEAQARLA